MPKGAILSSSQCLWGLPVWGPTVRSLDLPLVAELGITEREREATCTQQLNKAKPEQLKLSKIYPSTWPYK
jgi:hypothetical protein